MIVYLLTIKNEATNDWDNAGIFTSLEKARAVGKQLIEKYASYTDMQVYKEPVHD